MSLEDTNTPGNDASTGDATVQMDNAAPEQQPIDVMGSGSASSEEEDLESMMALKNLKKSRAAKKRKKRITIIAAIAVAAGLAAVLLGQNLMKSNEPEEEAAPETTTVVRGDFENVISSSGALKAGSTVMVTPEVEGTIERVLVSEGQQVKKDDLLFVIKNDTLDKDIRDAARDLAAANDEVAAAQTSLNNAHTARDEAWERYNSSWAEADAKHSEWAYLTENYDRLHAEWEVRKAEAEALACGKPENPGVEPTFTLSEPVEPDPSDPEYAKKKKAYDEEKHTYDKEQTKYEEAHALWLEREQQFLEDTEAYKAYQDALAKVGDEPQPAGTEPTYPDAPDDTTLISAIQTAEQSIDTAQRSVAKSQEAYDEAVANAEKRNVKAPSSGNIVSLGAKVGAAVGSGSGTASSSDKGAATTLVQISDVNQMSVGIEVNEIDILNIKKGQNAKVTFSAVKDVECDANVTEVATVATSGGGEGGGVVTFHVGLTIPLPDKALREGMTANVKIYTASVKDALLVPSSAVTDLGGSYTVQVVVDQETFKTETREVSVGERNSMQTVITAGLEEGETVLLGGAADAGADEGAES